MSKTLEEFDVAERPFSVLVEKFPNITVIHSAVKSLHTQSHVSGRFAECNKNLIDLVNVHEYNKLNFM